MEYEKYLKTKKPDIDLNGISEVEKMELAKFYQNQELVETIKDLSQDIKNLLKDQLLNRNL